MRFDSVALEKLEFDLNNPRFEPCDNQLDALALLCGDFVKIANLMQHIAEYGLNPSERIIVGPSTKRGKFVVLEGNRRLAALKFLSKPELLDALEISDRARKTIRKARSVSFDPSEIAHVDAVVFEEGEDSSVWIDLKHTGENGGAGVVGWDGLQTARYRQSDPTLAVIEFAIATGLLPKESDSARSFPITNLQRLLGDPYVREAIGINVSKGQVTSNLSKVETERGLRRIFKDLSSGAITVSDIKRKGDRAAYIDSLPKRDLPNQTSKIEPWALVMPQTEGTGILGATKSIVSMQRSARDRLHLIPRELKLEINDFRLNKIYWELKRELKLGAVVNATAVLFRTFVELSLDLYLEANGLPTTKKGYELKLDDKMSNAIEHLELNGVLTAKGARLARLTTGTDSVSNPLTFHAFVHDRTAQPAAVTLIAMWTHVEPLLVAIFKAKK